MGEMEGAQALAGPLWPALWVCATESLVKPVIRCDRSPNLNSAVLAR